MQQCVMVGAIWLIVNGLACAALTRSVDQTQEDWASTADEQVVVVRVMFARPPPTDVAGDDERTAPHLMQGHVL